MELAEIAGEPLAAEHRIAVGYMAPELRPAMSVYFALDQRLGRIVAKTTEPMLGQMRLAWWRDMFAKPASERPNGDAVLDAVGEHWEGGEGALSSLVDGWEHMLVEPPLDEDALLNFANGRISPMLHLVDRSKAASTSDAEAALRRWVLADAAANTVEGDERLLMLRLARSQVRSRSRFARGLRGFAVLDALARRSVERDGRPLMEGRAAALIALRAGVTGY